MRTLSETAQADIIKLTGGRPWCEVIDITLPDDYEPSATELTFLSKDPDDLYHILISRSIMESRLAIVATGWATQGLTAGYKWYFGVPYQRDPIEDSGEKKGAVNSRIMLGDTGGTIKAIVDKCDGFIGLNVSIGFAMVNSESAFTVSTGFLECYEPDVTYDWQVKTTTHDKTYFSCTLFIDSPVEWKFPPRTMFKNVCHFAFKGTECGFDGNVARLVKPKRGADIIGKSIYPGGWLISGGYVEKLDLTTGSVITTTVPAFTDSDYEFITAVNGNYCYAKRAGSLYAAYYDNTAVALVEGSSYYRIVDDPAYPLEYVLSSGAAFEAYAITSTATTRRLYRFVTSGAQRVEPGQYYNVVSSAAAGIAFAIQGGTYSGDAFTPSDAATGRLVRINETTQTSIGGAGIAWKWVRAVSDTVCFALDSTNKLWWTRDLGSGITLYPVKDPYPSETQVEITGTLSMDKFSATTEEDNVFIISDGDLYIINEGNRYYTDDTRIWHSIKSVSGTEAVGFNDGGISIAYFTSPEKNGIADLDIGEKGYVSDILPCTGFSIGSPKFYYVAGGNLYLYEYKPYATCNHRLSDCLARGNQERFGGYPGIGSGGLTK